MAKYTPKAFIPTEDQSLVMRAFNMPPGTSLERTKAMIEQADSVFAMYFNALVSGEIY